MASMGTSSSTQHLTFSTKIKAQQKTLLATEKSFAGNSGDKGALLDCLVTYCAWKILDFGILNLTSRQDLHLELQDTVEGNADSRFLDLMSVGCQKGAIIESIKLILQP